MFTRSNFPNPTKEGTEWILECADHWRREFDLPSDHQPLLGFHRIIELSLLRRLDVPFKLISADAKCRGQHSSDFEGHQGLRHGAIRTQCCPRQYPEHLSVRRRDTTSPSHRRGLQCGRHLAAWLRSTWHNTFSPQADSRRRQIGKHWLASPTERAARRTTIV